MARSYAEPDSAALTQRCCERPPSLHVQRVPGRTGKKIRSANPLERLNKDQSPHRRRGRVPHRTGLLRLTGAVLVEAHARVASHRPPVPVRRLHGPLLRVLSSAGGLEPVQTAAVAVQQDHQCGSPSDAPRRPSGSRPTRHPRRHEQYRYSNGPAQDKHEPVGGAEPEQPRHGERDDEESSQSSAGNTN